MMEVRSDSDIRQEIGRLRRDLIDGADDRSPRRAQCLHRYRETRCRTFTDGTEHFQVQCLVCGEGVGTFLKKEDVPDGAPPWNDEVPRMVKAARAERWKKEQRKRAAEYGEYLESDEWRLLRSRVLTRDGNLCQGCLAAEADEVHHLTYRDIGAELAFQLVSLCHPCHERMHSDRRQFDLGDEVTVS